MVTGIGFEKEMGGTMDFSRIFRKRFYPKECIELSDDIRLFRRKG